MKVSKRHTFPFVLLVLLGCSSDEQPGYTEDIHRAAAELSRNCANATPSAVFIGDVSFLSATTYNPRDCAKAQVVEVREYANNLVSAGAGGRTRTREDRRILGGRRAVHAVGV